VLRAKFTAVIALRLLVIAVAFAAVAFLMKPTNAGV
jgi:hypothetical protein